MMITAHTVSCGNNHHQPFINEALVDTIMSKLLFPAGKNVLTGGDGAISIVIDKKKSLWLWGDSFVGESTGEMRESTIPSIFGNVFILLDGDSARTIYGGTPEQPLPVIVSENVNGCHAVYWPHHGFVKNGILHLFASNIVFGGSGMWDFYCRALVYCRLSYPDFALIDRQEMLAYPVNNVDYGFGLHEYRGHYYFYGSQFNGFKSTLHVGRARLIDNILQDWEYFDGTGWTVDPSKTNPLSGIDVPISSQFSIIKYKKKFILLSQERGIGTNDIYTFVADNPVGPWYNKKKIYSTPEPVQDSNLFAYNAMAHPQYDKDGMLLVSYCLNMHNPTHRVSDYRPRFIRVPYRLIMN